MHNLSINLSVEQFKPKVTTKWVFLNKLLKIVYKTSLTTTFIQIYYNKYK